jgi:hypothetical protein
MNSPTIVPVNRQALAQFHSDNTLLRAAGGIRTAALENLKTKVHHASLIGKALNFNKFSLPVKKSYRGLIDVARAFAVEAVPFASEFTKHGVPPESITAAVAAFEEALLNGTNAKAKKKAAKEKWAAVVEATLLTVKRLDVLVETTLAAEPGPLATYEAARTVRHGRGRKIEESTVTESAATATAA